MTAPLILIEEEVLQQLAAEVTRVAGAEERGGILLGTRRGEHFHLDEATMPMADDRASRFAFRRASAGHHQVANRRWRQSRQFVDWLGEWHSHPENQPRPSSIDLNSWRSIARARRAPMIFLIVGYQGHWLGLMRPGSAKPIVYVEHERSAAGIGFAPLDLR